MNKVLSNEILHSSRFQDQVANASLLAILHDLPMITTRRHSPTVDWPFALSCCSLLASSDSEEAQDAVLRVAHACLVDPAATREHRAASVLLFERLGNAPAIRLAELRRAVVDDVWSTVSPPLMLDVIRSRLQLAIPTRDMTLHVNRFQRSFWAAASSQSWTSVSAPTSAGKSFIVRHWVAQQIGSMDTLRCVYIVPTRALIEETSRELRTQFPADARIYTLPWDANIGSASKEIFVFTQERLHLLQQEDRSFYAELMVVDEAQKFGDDSRGVLLQRVLDEAISRYPESTVLFASPLSENPELLLDSAPPGIPTDALIGTTVTVSQNLFWVNQVDRFPKRWSIVTKLPKNVGEIGEVHLAARPSPSSQILALLTVSLADKSSGNVIYVNAPGDAEKVARQVYEALGEAAYIGDNPDIVALRELSQKTIHKSYALNSCLERGVAFHYGNIPLLLRGEIERLFRIGVLRFLVCTSTLLEGVNLPCRNLFVRGPRRGRGRPMSLPDFWNLAGRAGRWGKEFQGNIFCVDTDDRKMWPSPPLYRDRYPLRRAADDTISDTRSLIEYIASGTPARSDRSLALLESVYSLLASKLLEDGSIDDMPSVRRLDQSVRRELSDVVQSSLDGIDAPHRLIRRHAGISPLSMQRLLDYFRSQDDVQSLLISPPESRDAVASIAAAFRVLQQLLGGGLGSARRQYMLALLVVTWMRGAPLASIIAARLRYLKEHGRQHVVATVIRECLSDVEQIARFEAPRVLSCYVDLLNLHISELGLEDDMQELPDLAMLLELGVSRKTELSLVTLGLSRTSAIAVSEYIIEDEFQSEECVEWLRSVELDTLDLPELVRVEIRKMLEHQPTSESL